MSEEPLYHCLSLEEWVKVTSALSYSEVKVLYYLLCQNPMGDRQIDCRVRTVAKVMNMSTGAVSTAIKQLEAKGLIESVEIVRAEITIKPRLISAQAQKLLDKQQSKRASNDVQPTEHDVQPTEHDVQPTEHDVQPTEHDVQPTEHTHIYRARARTQTYSDFIQTLSNSERESFEKFVREEWKSSTGKEVINLERFLAGEEDFKNWQERFFNSPVGQEAKKKAKLASIAGTDWTQHPDWENWLAQMRESVPRFVALGTCFDNKTRREIADWACGAKLVWGDES